MKHNIKGGKFNRSGSHRKAMFANIAVSLIKHESIKTTLSKAKELRPIFEKLVTMSKFDSVSNRRKVMSKINNRDAVNKLFMDLSVRYSNRNGGYIRIVKIGHRIGDSAKMAFIELIEKRVIVATAA